MRWTICPNWSEYRHRHTHSRTHSLYFKLCIVSTFLSNGYREVCESSVLLNLKKRFHRDWIYVSLNDFESFLLSSYEKGRNLLYIISILNCTSEQAFNKKIMSLLCGIKIYIIYFVLCIIVLNMITITTNCKLCFS